MRRGPRPFAFAALLALSALCAPAAAASAPEPVEVRLLRTVHLGALQGLAEADLRRMSSPAESSYVRHVLSRAALLVLGRDTGAPEFPVERLLDEALAQLKPDGMAGLLPSGAPPGFGTDDLVYTLTYALAVSGRGAAAEQVLERNVGGGSELKRCVAMQALHNLGSRHGQEVIQQATQMREIAFEASTLLVQDQYPPLQELAAHWHDIPLTERSREELARDMESGCGPRAILALFLAGYLPPADDPVEQHRELEDLHRAALELPLQGCYNGRMFGLRSYGLRTRGVPSVWAALAGRLETGWQRVLAARIGFAHYPQEMVPAALDRLAVEPEQDVQWELLWATLFAGKGLVFRDYWDLWNLSPHRQLRLSFPGSFPRIGEPQQDRLLDWLESGHRPGDGRVYDWLLCELARSVRGAGAFRLLRVYLTLPAAERHPWVLQDLAEPATLPALRYLRDHAPTSEDREALSGGIEILEGATANLYTGKAPEICCAPTPECLLSQYEQQVFRKSDQRLQNEAELKDWIGKGLAAKPEIKFLDSLQRVAEIRDGRGPKPLRFEHLYGCWRWITGKGETEPPSRTP
jgi:hypothetical protein